MTCFLDVYTLTPKENISFVVVVVVVVFNF